MSRIIKNIKIEKIGEKGIGLSETENGKKIIIKGSVIPNSIVDIKIHKEKTNYIEGKVIKIHKLDKDYIDKKRLCPHNMIQRHITNNEHLDKIGCGGCKRNIIPYPKQLELKKQSIIDAFQKTSIDVNSIKVNPAPQKYYYRNKIEFSFGKYIRNHTPDFVENTKKIRKHWQLGFHKKGDYKKIVSIKECQLADQSINKVYKKIKKHLKDSKLPVYDTYDNSGFFRHLLLRSGHHTNDIMINLGVANQHFEEHPEDKIKREKLKNTIKEKYKNQNIKSFMITHNNGKADIMKGKNSTTKKLFGQDYIYEKLKLQSSDKKDIEMSFKISPFSFFQTNSLGAQKLFNEGIDLVSKTDGHILDLYCGTGTIGLSFLKAGIGSKLYGVDITNSSINDAKQNAKLNNLGKNTYFSVGKARDVIYNDKNIKENLNKINTVIIDPPRAGLHPNVIKFLDSLKDHTNYQLLYISCNPNTMSRDLDILVQRKFKINHIEAIDMFPHTPHIEMISLLNF